MSQILSAVSLARVSLPGRGDEDVSCICVRFELRCVRAPSRRLSQEAKVLFNFGPAEGATPCIRTDMTEPLLHYREAKK